MSTKIYNGYKIVGLDMTKPAELFKFCQDMAASLTEIQKEETIKLMGLYLAMEYDLAAAASRELVTNEARPIRVNDDEGAVIAQVMAWVSQRVYKASKSLLRDPEFDMSCNVSIFSPYQTVDQEFYPAMLFCDRRSYQGRWIESPHVEDFHYQNQSDEPEGMDPKEWAFREAVWDEAMPHGKPPAEVAFNFDLTQDMAPFSLRERMGAVVEATPDYEGRMRVLARQIASDEKIQEMMGDREPDDFTADEKIRMSTEVAKWLHENREANLEARKPVIEEFLVKKITLDRVLHPMSVALG